MTNSADDDDHPQHDDDTTVVLEQKPTAETVRTQSYTSSALMEDISMSEAPSDEEASYAHSMVLLEEANNHSFEMSYVDLNNNENNNEPSSSGGGPAAAASNLNHLYLPRTKDDPEDKQYPDIDDISAASSHKKRPILGFWKSILCLVIFAAIAAVVAGVVSSKVHENSQQQNQNQPSSNNQGFDFSSVSKAPATTTMTDAPTLSSSASPTMMTLSPTTSSIPSMDPTSVPTTMAPQVASTFMPTKRPTRFPTPFPTPFPTEETSSPTQAATTWSPTDTGSEIQGPPSTQPSWAPVSKPPTVEIDFSSPTLLTMCVIADVPYIPQEVKQLPKQLETQMQGCEFLVHLGDIFKTIPSKGCVESRYTEILNILRQSTIPVYMILGDNEWNDCGSSWNVNQGWSLWNTHLKLLDREWDNSPGVSSFNVTRPSTRSETFTFVAKRTLLVGLNIVGGRVHDADEWQTRLTSQADWVIHKLIPQSIPSKADGVILMAHARPSQNHEAFFRPIREYLQSVNIPVLYLHGDGHSFVYTPGFQGVPNLLAIQHEGGTRDPILKIHADPALLGPSVYSAFQFDRQLELV